MELDEAKRMKESLLTLDSRLRDVRNHLGDGNWVRADRAAMAVGNKLYEIQESLSKQHPHEL